MSNKQKPKEIVVRITGLPIWTTIERLKISLTRFPNEEMSFTITETTMCLSCYNDRTKTAITQFSPYCPEILVQLTNGSSFVTQFEGCDIRFDKDFYGLTPLYAPEGPIKADIIALSGLDGHAYGSWRAKTHGRRMWLREFFSQDFPGCRTMIYGYNSRLQCKATHTVLDFTRGLLEELAKARKSEMEVKRPIIFIGHSFGGVVIVQSLVRARERKDDQFASSLLPATYATIFFGTPHRGLIIDDIKSMLDQDSPRKELLDSINKNSDELKEGLSRFMEYCDGIKIVSFYETRQTRKLKKEDGRWSRNGEYFNALDNESAILHLPDHMEKPLPAEGDHSDMVKLCHRDDSVYTSIVSHLKRFSRSGNYQNVSKDSFISTYSIPSMPRQDTLSLRRLLESGLLGINEATPCLHQAIIQQDQETLSILLQHKVDPEACYTKAGHALETAASTGNAAIFELLLKGGAVVNTRVLHSTVVQGHAQLLELLLQNGVGLPETDLDKRALLYVAASGGHHNVIESLLRHGVDINYMSPDMGTGLHCAAANGQYRAVQVLLENNADTLILGPEKRTALETAAEAGHVQVFQLLLEKTLRRSNAPFRSALNIAAAGGHAQVVECLLENWPGILQLPRIGSMTVLQIAAKRGHTKVVKSLLDAGVDTEEEMYETGQTALYLAHTPEIVELLLERGAIITAEDRSKTNRRGQCLKGYTKLHEAASWGQIEIVKVLLKYGDDIINIRDSDGHTPAYYANVTSHWHTLDYLQRHGGVTTLATSDPRCIVY